MARTVGIILFPRFELLDVYGPAEMFGRLADQFRLCVVAETKGAIVSNQGASGWADASFANCPPLDLILVPGGMGTRHEVTNEAMLSFLRQRVPSCEIAMTVCTGAALFARAGLLDGRRATTNKRSFTWVESNSERVTWVKEARWVEDGRFFTSSGVSAGIDMSLAVIAKLVGREVAEQAARETEYEWHRDASWDPFARVFGLVD